MSETEIKRAARRWAIVGVLREVIPGQLVHSEGSYVPLDYTLTIVGETHLRQHWELELHGVPGGTELPRVGEPIRVGYRNRQLVVLPGDWV